ncbi:MAG: FKBP-type peptidyl-prolyl cis-trans isomerase [Chitinophagales bacterium]
MFKYKKILIAVFTAFIGIFSSCEIDTPIITVSSEDQIQAYLTANNLTTIAQKTDSGLYYIIEDEGIGPNPSAGATVSIHYRGTLVDGTVFDSSYERGKPTDLSLNSVILGWQEGIPLFKKGGRGSLIIPFELAYGSRGNGDIPPNTIILFDIELIDFDN